MSVPVAFLAVVLIWATTPLAIQWSGAGPGWLFGVGARMVLGAMAGLAVVALLRQPLPLHRTARPVYLAVGVSIYVAMSGVYWAAQYIPSGWISVIFGLAPMATAVMAALWLGERSLAPLKLLGMAVAVAGLAVIFGQGGREAPNVSWGVAGVLLSVLAHAAGAVWVKRLGATVPALAQTVGGVSVAAVLFAGTWLVTGAHWPEAIPPRALWSIVYLAVVGSVVGFLCYFYVLKHVEAGKVALTTLVTPVLALLLGSMLNGEAVAPAVWLGAGLILSGLALHQWGGFARRLARKGANARPAGTAPAEERGA